MKNSVNKTQNIQKLHDESCEKGLDFYVDPATGYQVFTAIYHKRRGACCHSGCRHCPWRKSQIPDKKTT